MEQNKVLPNCPHCGGEAKLRTFTSRGWLYKVKTYYVQCTSCMCQSPVQLTAEEAEEIWERRVTNADIAHGILEDIKKFSRSPSGYICLSDPEFAEIERKYIGE
jgi:phage terminase large subunit GpA-like protein